MENTRNINVRIAPGPYLAKVTNHLDTTYMGMLEATLVRSIPGVPELDGTNLPFRYCSPFSGVSSIKFEGNDSSNFNDVQKSYGFWMIPPDVGTTIMVIFLDGDVNSGFWMGCISDQYQNHMIPGLAASEYVALTPEQETKYGTRYLPVAEYHKKSRDGQIPAPDTFTKPVHPFADVLLKQGLILDTIRGPTSSSARREVPSQVYGISTPGPVDSTAPKKQITPSVTAPVSRLGGTTFVMDDGDKDGLNELVRIRTRTGHQILLHNSSDLIYIANSGGTAWIELTSAGKIDVYGEDSISIRTKGDFNFHADRDFNLEAGRNFNIATNEGKVNINSGDEIDIISDGIKIGTTKDFNLNVTGNVAISATANINNNAGGEGRYTAAGQMSIGTADTLALSANGDLGLSGGNILASAGRIDLNGPTAPGAISATPAASPTPLTLFAVPQRDGQRSWANGVFYKAADLASIMQRIPSHEPWDQHENINPVQFSLDKTDTSVTPAQVAANGAVIPGGASSNPSYPAIKGSTKDRGSVHNQVFPWSTDQPFLDKVKSIAGALKFDPIDLLACMNLESNRTFDPSITNNLGYTGLIQFGTAAATSLGTTTSALGQLGRVAQMDWVLKYFNKWGWPSSACPNPTLANIYLTILLPALRFAGPNDKIADGSNPKTSGWYFANGGFDPAPKKGYFTPSMVLDVVSKHRREVLAVLEASGTTVPDLKVTAV